MDFIKTQETLIKLLPLWQNKIARPVPAADDAAERSALPIIRKQRLRPLGRAQAEGKQEAGGLLGRKRLGRDGQNFLSGRGHGS